MLACDGPLVFRLSSLVYYAEEKREQGEQGEKVSQPLHSRCRKPPPPRVCDRGVWKES
jgi:hypothetical protein